MVPRALFHEHDLPIVEAQREHVAVVAEVKEGLLLADLAPGRGCSVESFSSVAQAWITPRGPSISLY
jgi:hypothetical protein